jgi:hypothetical protein
VYESAFSVGPPPFSCPESGAHFKLVIIAARLFSTTG